MKLILAPGGPLCADKRGVIHGAFLLLLVGDQVVLNPRAYIDEAEAEALLPNPQFKQDQPDAPAEHEAPLGEEKQVASKLTKTPLEKSNIDDASKKAVAQPVAKSDASDNSSGCELDTAGIATAVSNDDN